MVSEKQFMLFGRNEVGCATNVQIHIYSVERFHENFFNKNKLPRLQQINGIQLLRKLEYQFTRIASFNQRFE